MGVFRLPVVRGTSLGEAPWSPPAVGRRPTAEQWALLVGLGTIALLAGAVLTARALRGESSAWWPLVADLVWLGLMAAGVVTRRTRDRLPSALLAGGPLFALGWAAPTADVLVLGLFGASLVVGALLLDGRGLLVLAGWYALLYLGALLHQATQPASWEEAAAPLVALAAVTIGAWSGRCARALPASQPAHPPAADTPSPPQQSFAGHLAHQVRTPLTAVRGAVQQLLADPAPSTERTRETLLEVDRAAARLSRLVDNLLILARADRGVPVATERVDVLPLVESVYEQARRWPGGERLHLAIGPEWMDGDWAVWGDGQLLQQLLLNLIDNALKYSGANAPVCLRLSATSVQVRIAVEDAGAPIPRAEQPHIFEQFYRGTAARHTGAPGTGLGLSIARWIAEAHQGQIELVELAQGKAFQLSLPAVRRAAP